MSDKNSANFLTDKSSVEKLKEKVFGFFEISKRELKEPVLLWKFGFPLL